MLAINNKLFAFGALAALTVGFGWATPASANHSLECLAERIENKTDTLEDVIEDRFERSPNYRWLERLSCRVEEWAEDLDEAIEDCDWLAANSITCQLRTSLGQMNELVGCQDVGFVPPHAVARATRLIFEINAMLDTMDAGLANVTAVVAPPVHRHPVFRRPIYQPGWPVPTRRNWDTPGFRHQFDRDDFEEEFEERIEDLEDLEEELQEQREEFRDRGLRLPGRRFAPQREGLFGQAARRIMWRLSR